MENKPELDDEELLLMTDIIACGLCFLVTAHTPSKSKDHAYQMLLLARDLNDRLITKRAKALMNSAHGK